MTFFRAHSKALQPVFRNVETLKFLSDLVVQCVLNGAKRRDLG